MPGIDNLVYDKMIISHLRRLSINALNVDFENKVEVDFSQLNLRTEVFRMN